MYSPRKSSENQSHGTRCSRTRSCSSRCRRAALVEQQIADYMYNAFGVFATALPRNIAPILQVAEKWRRPYNTAGSRLSHTDFLVYHPLYYCRLVIQGCTPTRVIHLHDCSSAVAIRVLGHGRRRLVDGGPGRGHRDHRQHRGVAIAIFWHQAI